MQSTPFNHLESVKNLRAYYESTLKGQHLKTLLQDKARNDVLRTDWKEGKIVLDSTHCKLDAHALDLLKEVAKETGL